MSDGRPRHSDVTAVVVTWRAAEFIDECLDALVASGPGDVLVVDNASDDGTAERLARRHDVRVRRLPRNVGFAGGIAAALAEIRSPFVGLVNDDAVVDVGWLAPLREAMERADVAGASAKLVLADGRINNAGSAVLPDGYGYDVGLGDPDGGPHDVAHEVPAVCGGAVLLRAAAVADVGGVAPEFFLYYEDTDLSFRLRRAGWRLRYEPASTVVHRHSASTDQASARFHFFNERNRLLFVIRNFPAPIVRHELWRFVRSIGGFGLRRARGESPRQASESVRLRLRVVASLLRLAPGTWRARRRIRRLGPWPGVG